MRFVFFQFNHPQIEVKKKEKQREGEREKRSASILQIPSIKKHFRDFQMAEKIKRLKYLFSSLSNRSKIQMCKQRKEWIKLIIIILPLIAIYFGVTKRKRKIFFIGF